MVSEDQGRHLRRLFEGYLVIERTGCNSLLKIQSSRSGKPLLLSIHQSINHTSTEKEMSQEYSKACCTIPPVVVKDYEEKGQWIMIDGMKTCQSFHGFSFLGLTFRTTHKSSES